MFNQLLKFKMNTITKLVLFFPLLFIVISCKDNIITECNNPGSNSASLTTFSSIQTNIFNENCATAGCHASPSPQAGLFLTEGNSYTQLLNVASVLNPNFKRIEPGNSANSFLIKMLKNTGEGTSQMPPTGKLSADKIDSIAAWIDRGAINN
jgi:hypothetical protein